MATDNDTDAGTEVTKFGDHRGVLTLLTAAQDVETDVREIVREVHAFLDDKDGQWDDHATKAFAGRPRYTLDKCNDLVDDIAGAIEQSDFDIQVLPAGGDASKNLAKTYDGLIRNIQNLSDAGDIYDSATRGMVRAGMDGWRVKQRFGDNNTFDQDLYIDMVADWVDRVWFDPNSVLQTREDAEYAFLLTSMTKRAYDLAFPEGKGRSVSIGDNVTTDQRTPENVVVGEIFYKVKVPTRIVELTTGAVYVDDDKFKKIQDELAAEGAVIKRERMREMVEVRTRLFDGDEWLSIEQKTVFDLIPLVPEYANWRIRKKVPNYWGIVTKKLDAQRIYNYVESRKVEDGAFAPLAKILATKTQIGSERAAWEALNVSADPVLPYEVDPEAATPPFKLGGADINPGLESTSQSMLQNLQSTAGIDQLQGQSLGLQSGLAVELKQQRGDTRNIKYTKSKQIAICYTGKILMRAIPKVYDTERQVRIINEDTSFDMVTLNQRIADTQTGDDVEVIDLSKGVYDVTCEVSKSFKNRQGETVNSIVEVASIDPTIIELGRDVLYKNMNAPGMDILSDRVRQKMVLNGEIPEDQLTDEEKELLESQPEPAPDPVTVALERQAEAEDDKIQLAGITEVRRDKEADARIAKLEADAARDSLKLAMEQITQAADVLNTQAASWKLMREALGVDSITGPGGLADFIEQARIVREAQAEQP